VNYDNSLVLTITVTCNLWVPSSGDHLFTCGAIYLPPHAPGNNDWWLCGCVLVLLLQVQTRRQLMPATKRQICRG